MGHNGYLTLFGIIDIHTIIGFILAPNTIIFGIFAIRQEVGKPLALAEARSIIGKTYAESRAL